jgi:ketosteroid isomerase-like protein
MGNHHILTTTPPAPVERRGTGLISPHRLPSPEPSKGETMPNLRAATIILAGLLAGLAVLEPPAAAAPATDVDGIKALEADFAKAANAKDLDGIMKAYVPDESLFVFDVTPPRQHAGAAAYRKDWEEFFSSVQGPVTFTLSDLAVTAAGTVGYGHSIQRFVAKDTKGKSLDFTVRVTDVYRKIKGKWLIVQEHVSVPVDLDTGKADLSSKP